MSQNRQATLRRVKRHDAFAHWVVTLGGAIVIVSVLGILVSILGTTFPLFYPARVRLLGEAALPPALSADDVVGLGIQSAANDSWRVAHVIDAAGRFYFVDLFTKQVVAEAVAIPGGAEGPALARLGPAKAASFSIIEKRPAPLRRTLLGAAPSGASTFTLRWSDGTVSLAKVIAKTEPLLNNNEAVGKILKHPEFSVEILASFPPDKLGVPDQAVLRRTGDDPPRCAAVYGGKQIVVGRQSEDLSGEKTISRIVLDPGIPAAVTSIALDRSGTMLYAGTSSGSILWWRLGDDQVVDHDIVPPLGRHAITSLELMPGDVTLVAGDSDGGVTNWFFVKPPDLPIGENGEAEKKPAENRPSMKREIKKLTYIRSLASHGSAIREIVPAPRNRALLVRDQSNLATMDYTTSQRRLLSIDDVARIAFSSRGDEVAAISLGEKTRAAGQIKAWRIEGSLFGLTHSSLHPEVSWSSLFGRVWYEGLNAPEFSWQTQGDAEYEPKLSLVPLIFGTVKGTFYAMIFAVPLALGAAAYVSHFTSPRVRGVVKPAIEMMAAIPSVVLGFLVGLWLAPLLHDWLFAFFLSLVTVPLVILIFLKLWQWARKSPAGDKAEKIVRGREFLITALLIGVGLATAGLFSAPLEERFFGGDVVRWMYSSLGLIYVQGNSILIAFGVGFLVIPMIFTLSEDALSSVPHGMTAASMALGASRWQTLWRVVLPSASPGIFAAVMMGLGRAVGETMVFLMATGDTALIDLSPFNGMRTLAANIAEERPGAPEGGTLYRTLFLCAVILFIMTFFLNTMAEFVRQRLRKRYGQF